MKADSFFGNSEGVTLGAPEFDETHSEQEGDQVGPCILRQRSGEGGFGLVWIMPQNTPPEAILEQALKPTDLAERIACQSHII